MQSARKQLTVLGVLLLSCAMLGDGRRDPAPPFSHPSVRVVLDANFGDTVARQFQRLLPALRIETVSMVGSGATVSAIQHGEADVGFALADVAYSAYQHAASGSDPGASSMRGMAALEPVAMHVLVRVGLAATAIRDLVGYRVGVGTALSSQPLLANLLFHAYGLGPEIVQPDRRTELLAGVDATIAVGYYPAPTVTDAMARGAHLIPIDGTVATELRREYPFVRSVTIPARTYPGQADDISTLGVQRLLITSTRLDEQTVHDLTRVFIETLPQLSASLHTSIRLTNLDWASATPIPLHVGAAQYYRERELMQ